MNVAFGKNRVQHRTFEWQVFEQGNFEVHHYREETKSQAKSPACSNARRTPWHRCLAVSWKGRFRSWCSTLKKNSGRATWA